MRRGRHRRGTSPRSRTPSTYSHSNEVFVYSLKHAKVHGALYFQDFHDFFTMQIFGPRNVLQDVPQGQREPPQPLRKPTHDSAHPPPSSRTRPRGLRATPLQVFIPSTSRPRARTRGLLITFRLFILRRSWGYLVLRSFSESESAGEYPSTAHYAQNEPKVNRFQAGKVDERQ